MDNFWISFFGELDEGYKPDFRISKSKPDFYEGYCYTYVYNSDFVENLKLENARYREALEFYANRMGMGGTAREALKGGE